MEMETSSISKDTAEIPSSKSDKVSSTVMMKYVIFVATLVVLSIVVVIIVLVVGADNNNGSLVDLEADKASFAHWPDASIFVPWDQTLVPINYSRFSSVTPYDPSQFTGSQAFLALNGGNFLNYGLPFETVFVNDMNPLGTKILITPRVLKVGLFGVAGDITQAEFEIVRDCIEAMTFVTPSLTIQPAESESETNFAVYIANDPDSGLDPTLWRYWAQTSPNASGSVRTNNHDGTTTLWVMRVSNQAHVLPCGGTTGNPCTNRGTIMHEFLHLMGMGHMPYAPSLMSLQQNKYMTKIDFAIIAAIWDPRIDKSVVTVQGMCDKLEIVDPICSATNLTHSQFLATARSDTEGWSIVEAFLCTKSDVCDIANASEIAAGFL